MSGDAVITDFASDRIDLTAFGFTRSELQQHVTIEEDGFLSDLPNWPDDRIRPLMETFGNMLLEQRVYREVFGVI